MPLPTQDQQTQQRRRVELNIPNRVTSPGQPYTAAKKIDDVRQAYQDDGYVYDLVNNIAQWAGRIKVGFEGANSEYLAEKLAEWRPVPGAPHLGWDDLIEYAYVRLVRDGNIVDRKALVDGVPSLYEINPAGLEINEHGRVAQGVRIDRNRRPVGYIVNPTHSGAHDPTRPMTQVEYPAASIIHIYRRRLEGQYLGQPMIARSIPAFTALRDLENHAIVAIRRALNAGLIIQMPQHLIEPYVRQSDAQGVPIDPDTGSVEEEEAAARLLHIAMSADPQTDRLIPPEVVVTTRPSPEVPSGADLTAVKQILIQRAARSADVSPSSVEASFGSQGYLSARFATHADEQTYAALQRLGMAYAEAVLSFWVTENATRDQHFRHRGPMYTLTPSAVPMANQQVQAMTFKTLREMGVVSKQAVARAFGYDYDVMLKEIEEEMATDPQPPQEEQQPDANRENELHRR